MATCVITLGADATVAALVAAVRECAAADTATGAIVVEVAAGIVALERHLILAAIAPLAIELAPGTRLCAIDVGAGAEAEDVAAVRDWLSEAECTTGQVVTVTGV